MINFFSFLIPLTLFYDYFLISLTQEENEKYSQETIIGWVKYCCCHFVYLYCMDIVVVVADPLANDKAKAKLGFALVSCVSVRLSIKFN